MITYHGSKVDLPLVSSHAIHLANGGGQQASKSASQRGRRKEERVAFLSFVATVPHANEVKGTRKHATLKHTQEESGSQETRVAGDKALQHSDKAETKHADGKPDARLELLEDDVGRDFEEDVRHEEDD